MKKYHQIIIVLFIILFLFIFRNDISSLFKKTSSYSGKDFGQSEIKQTKEAKLLGKVDMPGALKVATDLFSSNSQKVFLTKEKIIELTNKYRSENGNLPALKENKKLDASAEKKLQDMFTNQYFEHISPNKIGVADLSESTGYHYILIGENLAMGNFKDDETLVNAWIESKGHRENIVNKNYKDIGVAVGKGVYEGKEIWMAVQHFGTSQSVCPIIDQFLLGTININQNKLNEMEADLEKRREMINKRVVYEGNTYAEQVVIYNSLVDPYNNLVNDTKEKIIKYNNQVESYNSCIGSFQ